MQSANGNISLERVAEAGGSQVPLLMFQLYVFKDRAFTAKVIASAPRAAAQLCACAQGPWCTLPDARLTAGAGVDACPGQALRPASCCCGALQAPA